tara:strand:+ start:1086 stop:1322 length:237 start_codon:yes stop_codon:yes gene_type:complete
MRLIKDYAGAYYAEDVVDGYEVRVEVNSLNGRGWTWQIYIDNKLMHDDGWNGLTLREIKNDLNFWIDYSIKEYEDRKY